MSRLTEQWKPYTTLLSTNHNFRNLWLSQIVSNFGDWFALLAIYELILFYSGSKLLLGLIIIIKMLGIAVFSPIAGYISDRYDRRTIMIWCDIVRAVLVAGFLLIRSEETLWLAFVITALQMMTSAMFEPAKTASIPNVTNEKELVLANIISSLSWSLIFTFGMGIGGIATGLLGTDIVFMINVVTYFLSAFFVFKAVIPDKRTAERLKALESPWKGIGAGFLFLSQHGAVLRPTLAKGSQAFFLGALVYMLVLVSNDILLMGSLGLGILYASRGLGTAVGPIVGRKVFANDTSWVKIMGMTFIIDGVCYAMLGFTGSLYVMMLFVFLAHCSAGLNWVTSTILLQKRTPDDFRGRVFSTEWLIYTVSHSLAVLSASTILEYNWLSLEQAIVAYALGGIVVGALWYVFITRWEERDQREGKLEEIKLMS